MTMSQVYGALACICSERELSIISYVGVPVTVGQSGLVQ